MKILTKTKESKASSLAAAPSPRGDLSIVVLQRGTKLEALRGNPKSGTPNQSGEKCVKVRNRPLYSPCQNVKSVISLCSSDYYKDHDKALNWTFLGASDDLAFAFERNPAIPENVSELPGRTSAGLDLNRDMLAILV
ncbi:MAG: hypothetical protein ABSH11_04470 [Verrucomicrobiota bacterium]|jgi:hypothetical protein